MSFAEELKSVSRKVMEDAALNVSIDVQPKLKAFAEKGETECFMNPVGYESLMLNDQFIDLLRELLDGVNVEIVERATLAFFNAKRKEIRFSW